MSLGRSPSGVLSLLLGLIAWAAAAPPGFAQPADSFSATNGLSASAVRIDVSEAPLIDADLSDLAWAKATIITDFRQKEPVTTPSAIHFRFGPKRMQRKLKVR